MGRLQGRAAGEAELVGRVRRRKVQRGHTCAARAFHAGGTPAALPEGEIDTLRDGLTDQVCAVPHPYLKVGKRVRILRGPLAGSEGILIRAKDKDKVRVVVSIELLMRSVAVQVDTADLGSVL